MLKIKILPTSQYSNFSLFLTISSRFVVKNQNSNFPVFTRSNYEIINAKRRGDSPNDAEMELANSGKEVFSHLSAVRAFAHYGLYVLNKLLATEIEIYNHLFTVGYEKREF